MHQKQKVYGKFSTINFDGWDKSFTVVKSDLVICAKWKKREELSGETRGILCRDYLAYAQAKGWKTPFGDGPIMAEDISVDTYYGTVNGCEIARMSAGRKAATVMQPVKAAGYIIYHNSSQVDYIHAGGTFMDVKEAYDKGYFTKKDVYEAGCLMDPTFRNRY